LNVSLLLLKTMTLFYWWSSFYY